MMRNFLGLFYASYLSRTIAFERKLSHFFQFLTTRLYPMLIISLSRVLLVSQVVLLFFVVEFLNIFTWQSQENRKKSFVSFGI